MALVLGRMVQYQRLRRQSRRLAYLSTPPGNQRLHDKTRGCSGRVVPLTGYGECILAIKSRVLQVTGRKGELAQVDQWIHYAPVVVRPAQRQGILVAGACPLQIALVLKGHAQVVEH